MWFPILAPDGTDAFPIHDDGSEARWSYGEAGIERLKNEGRLVWKRRERLGEEVWVPYGREFAPDIPARPHATILFDVKTSRQAKAHQKDLLPDAKAFDTVKPEHLIARILDISTKPGDLVLDSFLGSGTTAAVAQKMGRRWIGVEMGGHAESHCQPRLEKVIGGEQGGISQSIGWEGGGGFRFFRLGSPVFDEEGRLCSDIRFSVLAAHIWFSETSTPWAETDKTPFLGIHDGRAYALLYNGILGDKRPEGGNVLTRPVLSCLRDEIAAHSPGFDGPLTIYGEMSVLSEAMQAEEGISFKQTPYDVKSRR